MPTFRSRVHHGLQNSWIFAIALITIFVSLKWAVLTAGQLAPHAYEQSVIFLQLIRNGMTASTGILVAVLLLFLATPWIPGCDTKVLTSWSSIEHSNAIRWIVCTAAFLTAWRFAADEFNHYFGQGYPLDRLIIVGLFAGICVRPLFVFPFLVVVYPFAWQTNVPLEGLSWGASELPLNLLMLFAANQVLWIACGQWRSKELLFLVPCFVAAHYFPSGLGKASSGWAFIDHIEFILPSTYANGWLGFLSPETISFLTSRIENFTPMFRALTIIAECGAILFFLNKRTACILTTLWILFHLGVFAISGICFWQWIALDIVILGCLTRSMVFRSKDTYTWQRCLLAMLIIGTASQWLRPVTLAWFDARANYTYQFNGITASGKRLPLPPQFFAPYDYIFTMSGFNYLTKNPTLNVVWGATGKQESIALAKATTEEALLTTEQALGKVRYQEFRANKLIDFLRRYVGNRNRQPTPSSLLQRISAPPLLWTLHAETPFPRDPIQRVEITQLLSFFDGTDYLEVRRSPVLALDIPQEQQSSP